MAALVEMITRVHRLFFDPTLLGSFVDNHDFERLAGMVNDQVIVKNAAVYPFVNDGIPFMYSGQEHGLRGGKDPMNREAIWLEGYPENTPLYHLFRSLNAARRAAIASNPLFLTTLMSARQIDNHTVSITKPPLLSTLSNYGSGSTAIPIYLSPLQTGYKPLLPVIDTISGQIFSTDPRGGLTIAIVRGEPRVFLPLCVHLGQAEGVTSWASMPLSVDTNIISKRPTLGSPSSPKAKRGTSMTNLFSWLGHGKGGSSMALACSSLFMKSRQTLKDWTVTHRLDL
ncbi:glycoside hydrolase superfamily [Kockovaella imperatae]|uniref:alpha-amylase n=1 Tax=Kockovaella imperatae TaxID=4999 RepID=A0A1Y1UAN4_9TREE|nr:glycoside hydrolase superfamily [Kockovaella imperatae]ORX34604.1 glycoside hydrolase superfamily [Kockovaella imperatae]